MPPISTIALGMACVCSCNRVPRPPQRIATVVPSSTAGRVWNRGVLRASGCWAATVSVAAEARVVPEGLLAAGNRGEDRHLVAVAELGFEPIAKANVLPGYVDVKEPSEATVLGDALPQIDVLVEDGIEGLAHGGALDLDLSIAVGDGPELGWDLHVDGHRRETLAGARDRLQLGLEALEGRLDLVHVEALPRGVERLQALAGDVSDDPVRGIDIPSARQLRQHRDSDPTRCLGEDAGGLGEQADALADLLVGHRVDRPARLASELERVGTVRRVPDRQALGDRGRALGLAKVATVRERGGDRAASLRLRPVERWQPALDHPVIDPLAEAPAELGKQRSRRDRADDPVRERPTELLDRLERQCLRALRVVGPKIDVHERPGTSLGELCA